MENLNYINNVYIMKNVLLQNKNWPKLLQDNKHVDARQQQKKYLIFQKKRGNDSMKKKLNSYLNGNSWWWLFFWSPSSFSSRWSWGGDGRPVRYFDEWASAWGLQKGPNLVAYSLWWRTQWWWRIRLNQQFSTSASEMHSFGERQPADDRCRGAIGGGDESVDVWLGFWSE